MNIIQIGEAKSGNLFVYNILKKILLEAGMWSDSYIQYHPKHHDFTKLGLSYPGQSEIDVLDITNDGCSFRVSTFYKEAIHSLVDYINISPLVWSHSPHCSITDDVLQQFDKIIYICRDGRDVVNSKAHFTQTRYFKKFFNNQHNDVDDYFSKELENAAKGWATHVSGYFGIQNIYCVFYEKLVHNFDQELESLLTYMGTPISTQSKAAIKQAVSFDAMKKKNPTHVRKGKSQQWINSFTDQQNSLFLKHAGIVLSSLGYPKTKNDMFDPSILTFRK